MTPGTGSVNIWLLHGTLAVVVQINFSFSRKAIKVYEIDHRSLFAQWPSPLPFSFHISVTTRYTNLTPS